MLIVLNPAAGQRHRQRLGGVLAALAARGVTAEVRATRHPGEAVEIARDAARAGASLVVAAGGDGTVSEVVNGLLAEPPAPRRPALGILPLGTANVLAHELAIPTSPADLADLLVRRTSRPIWPGVLDQATRPRFFVQMVGAGFDADVVRRVSPPLKRCIGGLAYAWQGLVEALQYPFPRIEVVIDGVATTTHGVIVSNGQLYAGRYRLAPDASPLHSGFSVVLFDRPGALPALAGGLALPLGQVLRLPGVRVAAARHVSVPGGAAPIQADGDPAGVGGFEVSTASRPIDVVMA